MKTKRCYTDETTEMLQKMGITFKTILIGSDCPTFCQDAEKGIDKDKVDTFPRKTHIHGKHYLCIFTRDDAKVNRPLSVDFWNSYSDEEYNYLYKSGPSSTRIDDRLYEKHGFKPYNVMHNVGLRLRIPTAYDVLACIQKSEIGTFEDFCSEFGYDNDSRKAEQVYQAVCKEWENVRKFFTAEELPLIQEIA